MSRARMGTLASGGGWRGLRTWALGGCVATTAVACGDDSTPPPEDCTTDCWWDDIDPLTSATQAEPEPGGDGESTGAACPDPVDAEPCHPACERDYMDCRSGERCAGLVDGEGQGTCEAVALLPDCGEPLAFVESSVAAAPDELQWLGALQADDDPVDEILLQVDHDIVLLDPEDGSADVLTAPRAGTFVDVVAADFDGDGVSELLTSEGLGTLRRFTRNAAGELTASDVANPAGVVLWQPSIVDWNLDGVLDLVSPAGQGGVVAVLGDGTGAFSGVQELIAGDMPGAAELAVARITEDALDDVAIWSHTSSRVVVGGTGEVLDVTPSEGVRAVWPLAADFDQDGRAEIVGGGMLGDWTLLETWTGGLAIHARHTVAIGPGLIVAGRVDADDIPDVAIAGWSAFDQSELLEVAVVRGRVPDADPSVLSCIQTFSPFVEAIAFGDFDGDGRLDFVGVRPGEQVLTLWLVV